MRCVEVHSIDLGHAGRQVAEEASPHLCVHTFTSGQETGDLSYTLTEAGSVFTQDGRVCVHSSGHLKSLQVPEVLHSHLKDVRLLQFGVSGAVFLECVQDQGLQLAQTLIDPRTSPLFHDWFRRLSALCLGPGFFGCGVATCRSGSHSGWRCSF